MVFSTTQQPPLKSKATLAKLFSFYFVYKVCSSICHQITPKRLIKLATKWQKLAAVKRLRISFPRSQSSLQSFVASKGHFVVYTTDEKRFMVPLQLLSKSLFMELFRLSEEEFGLPTDGPIRFPCDSSFLEYVIQFVQRSIAEDLEKALLTSLTRSHRSASCSSAVEQKHQQALIYGF